MELLRATGCYSPVMKHSNISYINFDVMPYDKNDLALNALIW